jgi:hypothetical protein
LHDRQSSCDSLPRVNQRVPRTRTLPGGIPEPRTIRIPVPTHTQISLQVAHIHGRMAGAFDVNREGQTAAECVIQFDVSKPAAACVAGRTMKSARSATSSVADISWAQGAAGPPFAFVGLRLINGLIHRWLSQRQPPAPGQNSIGTGGQNSVGANTTGAPAARPDLPSRSRRAAAPGPRTPTASASSHSIAKCSAMPRHWRRRRPC